jgi:2-methylcitrate dehydratase PrpD
MRTAADFINISAMSPLDRRDFLRTVTVAGFAAQAPLAAQQSSGTAPPEARTAGSPVAAATPPAVTRTLARYILASRYEDVPASVRHEAERTLLNWVGSALGGSRHETVDIALSAVAPFSGPAQASVLGRHERLDVMNAALLNGISSHIHDFDDTHLKTVIHPAGPVASAILALAEHQSVTGHDFMHALVLGVETECRIGNAVYPAHYDRGWHITGTAGVFGAAVAAGRLLKLTEQQMTWAIGIAAVQPVGLREMFGSMTKSFHPGRAAQNGLMAALLASRNFTSSDAGLEAKSGWANVVSTEQKYDEITGGLGTRYEAALNSYKPFACGIVIHPAIDACIQLRNERHLTAAQIERIDLRVHPLVLELTGKKAPRTGLDGKFSVYFAAAVAIVRGTAGAAEFTDEAVNDPAIVALRDRVTATVDPSIAQDQVRAEITLKDGSRLTKYIEHAVGSVERPMTDKDLEAKFLGNAAGVLPAARAQALLDLCWRAEVLARVSDIADAARA